ncbi:1,25-dihydroxyvitamin D(3) 24-hydroxylase, mitochondrial-like [Cydia fagiglandana]|uniref:1,25-dihydroxyvitamin D(3) 24-hydroxylase, mitochondrial-like n=1 Tax=Cydia fagiglandana TaxID=1458189 RepID=UPI002FEE5986
MLLNKLSCVQTNIMLNLYQKKIYSSFVRMQSVKAQEMPNKLDSREIQIDSANETVTDIYPAPRVVPMVVSRNTERNTEVLSFDQVPGPKALKYFSTMRQYTFQIGTQLTAGLVNLAFNISNYINLRTPFTNMSALFDEYGPVVRFVSPVGSDIVFLNHPDHIQKVFSMEGEYPVRSALDSLDKYRIEKNTILGLYSTKGEDWAHRRSLVCTSLHTTVSQNIQSLKEVCDVLTRKIYTQRNHQDELKADLYKELHKWSYDCMGLILFAQKFNMLETKIIHSQNDGSWLYNSLEKATDAIIKCESGFHMWKLFSTPTWYSLRKHCDVIDNLIGKHVLQAREANGDDIFKTVRHILGMESVATAMVVNQPMSVEDAATMLMDMLLLGVNTISSSTSFLLYYLAKHQRAQNVLVQEVDALETSSMTSVQTLKDNTPYLQACIRETLRLVPPMPIVTRILPKNIILDKYNIPKGTLIIMANQDTCRKESNFDDADRFYPERWLKDESRDYHAFASIPFGYGARKCLGQSMAEAMMSLLTIQILKKFTLEYHYGDIRPTKQLISKPNKPLKMRFVDRNN